MNYKMNLTKQEIDILEGKQGETLAKVLRTLVEFGETFGATKLVDVTAKGHLVTSFGLGLLKPVYRIMDELIAAGLKVKSGFTIDPRPLDFVNVKCNVLDKLIFSKIMYSAQTGYEAQLAKLGLISSDAFTCTCYLDEVGNIPAKGEYLSWAESSAVVYANSVLGARCNRNSGMLELFGSIVGKVPYFGLLTDEGRKATWRVEVKTTKKPLPQILGSAIGMKVMEEVPYVVGLDKWIGGEINDDAIGYLKDFGAATASNGAVGLYHIDGLTPEAKEQGEALLVKDYKTYVIDDAELERVYKSYPVMWKNKDAAPTLAFIGCPHLTLTQLGDWTKNLAEALKESGRKTVAVRTVMTTSPAVLAKFKQSDDYAKLTSMGVHVSSICPLMYTNNPIAGKKPIITCSNKLRTYSSSRYCKDDEMLAIISGKEVK